jgi:uncharacterized membrane protein YidH (DUF202 family)
MEEKKVATAQEVLDEEKKGADPKLIVAVQMTSIGVILIILGITVFTLSMFSLLGVTESDNPWTRYIGTCSIISNATIILVGVAFAIGGLVRHHERIKNKQ